jgi:hypothetical protein
MNERIKKSPPDWLVCALLAVATFAAYVSVAGNEFINLDDQDYVVNNLIIRRGVTWAGLQWAFTTLDFGNWHPVTWMSHLLDCQIFGVDPGWHHLTSLGFHVANTLLLFRLLQQLTFRLWPSAFVAMLFGLYPMHVESVAWVAERKDVLSGFFFLLTLLAYARYVEEFKIGNFWGGKAKWFYGACLILFALGLMSKPMLVTLPVILLLLDFWPLGRIQNSKFKIQNWKGLILEKLPFFVL